MQVENDVTQIKDVISALRIQHGWTEYQLAQASGIPQSTISSWYSKGLLPTLPSLQKICDAFGITLSYLFCIDKDAVELTPDQKHLLDKWATLSPEKQKALLALIENM